MPERRGRPKPPPRAERKEITGKTKKETEVSRRLTNFVLSMNYHQLTSEQRSQIFALLQRNTPIKEIARIVGCSESTVSRELKRNSKEKCNYLWDKAHAKAMARRGRTTSNRKLDDILEWRIKELIREDWSPEEIRGVLAKENISVSTQTIYNIINADTTGELIKHRRHPNFKRRKKGDRRPTKATNIPDRTSIHDRPQEADGTRFGDWEMDLIVDSCGHAILVLLDRLTGFVMLERLKHGKKAKPLAKVVIRQLFGYRKYLRTITTDNGSEFAAHLDITAGLRVKGMPDVKVYFADSYCSWQKGAVENVNKLIRQYIPKKSNFNDFSDEYIRNVGRKLNLRPRKRLGFSTPKEEFFKNIAKFALAS